MKDFSEKIVRRLLAKIIALVMVCVLKENAYAKMAGLVRLVIINCVLMIALGMEHVVMEFVNVIMDFLEKIALKVYVLITATETANV
jgi:hypothetical protein